MRNQHIRTELPGPNAQAMLERDRRVVSPSYPRDYPFVMSHGRDTEVWDVDGNRFIDFAAGIAVCSTGHAHPSVVAAIRTATEQFLHISSDYWHEEQIRLAELVAEIAPFEEPAMTFFCNSGTEAVEGALKLARSTSGRQRFIGFIGGFHGRTMGSLAFTASKYSQQAGFFPAMPGVTHVPYPNTYRPLLSGEDQGKAVLDYIENVLFQSNVPANEVAGILVEPIQGEGGYLVPPESFLPGLRALCDRHGILLIADEVQAGAGRTGKMFACEHWGVQPDIVTMAKGVGSGMPIGLVVAKRSIMEKWKRGAHGNTYGGNPVCCAAASATLELVRGGLMQNAATMGAYMTERLLELQSRYPDVIGEVRGKGLMIGVELIQGRTARTPAKEMTDRLLTQAWRNGVLLLSCGASTLRLMPPLTVTKPIADEAMTIIEQSLKAVL
ncbi:MAG: acetyl ornithine aminotransferase family protein [Paraburkholderia sp.]|uniref:acetyl ornithine aminotransferase family protein n=1 Tax=Burkholderiaceae TaxID=119060 RepID=UPI0010F6986F|nr:acetyl ornithine aminotransferase family protein [Burkholderia sp. 4M9327F10]